MNAVIDTLVILGMFAVRLAIPIGITIALAYGLRRLDARWQAEALRGQQTAQLPTQLAQLEQSCWEQKGCSQEERGSCPTYQQAGASSMVAARLVLGVLPADCAVEKRRQAGGAMQPVKLP